MAASLAVEWAEHGIRVNSLRRVNVFTFDAKFTQYSPGYMLTTLTRTVLRGKTELRVSILKLKMQRSLSNRTIGKE
jgi:NAD(P)-dependent dehydrogenase (short-subunit alcohol dehydrogenase family)